MIITKKGNLTEHKNMICKICHKNETDNTSGFCWKCFDTKKETCEQCKLVDRLAPSKSYCAEHKYEKLCPNKSKRK